MRSKCFGLVVVWLLYFGSSLSAQTPKAIVIGIDGLRPDALQRAFEQGIAPNLKLLADTGTYCSGTATSDLTFSGPGWSDILYGVHRDKHRVTTNSVTGLTFTNSNQAAYPDLLKIVKTARPSSRTARWTTWAPLEQTKSPGGTDYSFFRDYSQNGDILVTQDAVRFYQQDNSDIAFFYLGDVDITGHNFGFHSRIGSYLAEIAETDQLVGQLVNAIKARPGYTNGSEKWLFVVCTDHGGNLGRGHAGNRPWDRDVFLIINGGDTLIQKSTFGSHNVDIVPTVLQHLRVTTPAHLDGQAVGLYLDPAAKVELGWNLVLNGDAEYDAGFASNSFDQKVSGWDEHIDADYYTESSSRTGDQSVSVIQYGSVGGIASNTQSAQPTGQNYFTGTAQNIQSSMVQLADLSALSDLIDSGKAKGTIEALLGGVTNNNDRASFCARFLSQSMQPLGEVVIGPVTASERGNATKMLLRYRDTVIPTQTRFVEFVLDVVGRRAGADNLSFVIETDDATPWIVSYEGFDHLPLKPFTQVARTGDGTDYCNSIPGWIIDNRLMASQSSEPAYNGVTAIDVESWIAEQGVQIGRGSKNSIRSSNRRNTALVFDADAWADYAGGETRGFNSAITASIPLNNVNLNSLRIAFDWEFASEDEQTSIVDVSFDSGNTWTKLLELDSSVIGDGVVLGGPSEYLSGRDFMPRGSSMLLRFSTVLAGNNWWFAVDNVVVRDQAGVIYAEDFEELPMLSFTAANRNSPSDGTDYTETIPGWRIDNRGMLGTSREPAYQGWRALDVISWVQEQAGQQRSIFASRGDNIAMVADADAWADYVPSVPAQGFNSYVTREYDLRGFSPSTLTIQFDWEFRVEASQRGSVDVSFDNGVTYQNLLDLNSASPLYVANQLLYGPSEFTALEDFNATSHKMLLRYGCTRAGNNWWFAFDDVLLTAQPTTRLIGDANGDHRVDFNDINPFVAALIEPSVFEVEFPGIDPGLTLDCDRNGVFDFDDINGFVAILMSAN